MDIFLLNMLQYSTGYFLSNHYLNADPKSDVSCVSSQTSASEKNERT